jgi:hypothetical protein
VIEDEEGIEVRCRLHETKGTMTGSRNGEEDRMGRSRRESWRAGELSRRWQFCVY